MNEIDKHIIALFIDAFRVRSLQFESAIDEDVMVKIEMPVCAFATLVTSTMKRLIVSDNSRSADKRLVDEWKRWKKAKLERDALKPLTFDDLVGAKHDIEDELR